MKVRVQVVTTTDDGQESIRDLACIERDDLTAESLGLSIAVAACKQDDTGLQTATLSGSQSLQTELSLGSRSLQIASD